MSTTTDAARVSGTPQPAGSVFRCIGNIGGCDKRGDDRCTITVKGPPTQDSESLYMCPFNHWRSAKWEMTPNPSFSSATGGPMAKRKSKVNRERAARSLQASVVLRLTIDEAKLLQIDMHGSIAAGATDPAFRSILEKVNAAMRKQPNK